MKYKMPKSLRGRKRYIKFFIDSESAYSKEDIKHAIWNSMLSFLGEKGSAGVNLLISEWNEKSGLGIVRVSFDSVDDVIVCMKLIREINGKRTNIRVRGISGTLKSLEGC